MNELEIVFYCVAATLGIVFSLLVKLSQRIDKLEEENEILKSVIRRLTPKQ